MKRTLYTQIARITLLGFILSFAQPALAFLSTKEINTKNERALKVEVDVKKIGKCLLIMGAIGLAIFACIKIKNLIHKSRSTPLQLETDSSDDKDDEETIPLQPPIARHSPQIEETYKKQIADLEQQIDQATSANDLEECQKSLNAIMINPNFVQHISQLTRDTDKMILESTIGQEEINYGLRDLQQHFKDIQDRAEEVRISSQNLQNRAHQVVNAASLQSQETFPNTETRKKLFRHYLEKYTTQPEKFSSSLNKFARLTSNKSEDDIKGYIEEAVQKATERQNTFSNPGPILGIGKNPAIGKPISRLGKEKQELYIKQGLTLEPGTQTQYTPTAVLTDQLIIDVINSKRALHAVG